MTELLAPAGNFKIALKALYSGADAIYLATSRFGARAYAKNLDYEELVSVVKIAHVLNKKVYVTVNTLIKDEELKDVYEYLDSLALAKVDAVIATDYAVINYIINNLPTIECHISTQVGVKNIHDTKYFENLGAKRVVLAREASIDDIIQIKELTKMPIEVFIHGALCVSYSGNCYMSSMLTLRSGNRGRCSQNCRFEYELIEDTKVISKKGNLLAMKDLNSFDMIPKLKELNVDSLKIEGRMKDEEYVSNVVKAYRNKLDDKNYKTDVLNKVFHREYTKGFLAKEDNSKVVYTLRSGNIGDYLGNIKYKNNYTYYLDLNKELTSGERIRINDGNKDYYFSSYDLLDINKKQVKTIKKGYLVLKEEINGAKEIYRIKELSTSSDDTTYFLPLSIYLYGNINETLKLSCIVNDKVINLETNNTLSESLNRPLTYDLLFDKLNHFDIYPFKLEHLELGISDNLFISMTEINNLRRELIKELLTDNIIPLIKHNEISLSNKYNYDKEIVCKCYTYEQYLTCKEMGIKTIFYDSNIIPYTSSSYDNSEDILLIKNYGALMYYNDRDITLDYEFNVMNSDSLALFYNSGAKHITISKELCYQEIVNLYKEYTEKYYSNPNLDLIIYGRSTLMTMKYCVIKNQGKCPGCKTHNYALKDNFTTFPLIHTNCVTHILNDKPLNLIDNISQLKPYITRFRLDFTTETKDEVKHLVKCAKLALEGNKVSTFDGDAHTRGYFKRKIM